MANNTIVTGADPVAGPSTLASISWRAIFAGLFIGLLTYMILMFLGVAIGGATIQGALETGGDTGGLSIGSGIWLVLSILISLFVGSYFSGQAAGLIPARIGAVQGLVVCALFFGLLFSQIGATIGSLGRGVGSIIGSVGGGAGSLAQNPQVQDTLHKAFGDMNLKSPPEQVAQGVAVRMLRGNEESAKVYLAREAGVPRQEIDQRFETFKAEFNETAKNVGTQTAKAVSIAGWTLFAGLLLGSIFSALGGSIGARMHLTRAARLYSQPGRRAA